MSCRRVCEVDLASPRHQFPEKKLEPRGMGKHHCSTDYSGGKGRRRFIARWLFSRCDFRQTASDKGLSVLSGRDFLSSRVLVLTLGIPKRSHWIRPIFPARKWTKFLVFFNAFSDVALRLHLYYIMPKFILKERKFRGLDWLSSHETPEIWHESLRRGPFGG